MSFRIIVKDPSELPQVPSGWRGALYLDTETRSGDRKRGGLEPWHGDRVCGIAMTCDDRKLSWYAPVRHRDERWNLPVEPVMRWAQDWIKACAEWRNHNVKFDAKFLLQDGVEPAERLVDTIVLARLHHSDMQTYGLKPLAKTWLGADIGESDAVQQWMTAEKTKDFGDVPADILGTYACKDVELVRDLYRWLDERVPPEMAQLRETETKLTSLLLRIERRGLKTTNHLELKKQQLISLRKMVAAADELHKLTGLEFVNSNDHFHELLVVQMGLPVLGRTETGNPSFEADVLTQYLTLPEVALDPGRKRVIELGLEYRKEQTFKSLFADSFLEKADQDGIIHSDYNQNVRTGRMSCSNPNAQQMSERAKGLIVPRGAFLGRDASQVEFRIIAHYIEDRGCIEAYAADANTDFHQWVADLCKIPRRPAKNVNFAMGYGAGKRKVLAMLAAEDSIIQEAAAKADELKVPSEQRRQFMVQFTTLRAAEVFATYHERLPGIHTTSRQAEGAARMRGYVRNAYGRRRYLPPTRCHIALNSVVQSSAGDYVKERMIAVEPVAARHGLHIVAQVHDEILFEGPAEACADPAVQAEIDRTLSAASVPFRVPFAWTGGVSTESWAKAKGK